MDSNPLHNAMIKYICEKQIMMQASNADAWWRFKHIEGVKFAQNHSVADLAKIFRNEILPNISNYTNIARDPFLKLYMGHHQGIVIPDNQFNINDYPNISHVNMFEAQRNKENREDNLNVTNPIVTDEITSLTHLSSTQAEIKRGNILSIDEIVARLRYIENEKGTSDLQAPTLESMKNYHHTVAAAHNLDGSVRISDIRKSPQAITPQNRPILLLDSNNVQEKTGSEDLSIFGISDENVSWAEQRPPVAHRRHLDVSQNTTIDSCTSDLVSDKPSTSSIRTVNESILQPVEARQEATSKELQIPANVDKDDITSGYASNRISPDSLPPLNWHEMVPLAIRKKSSPVMLKKQRHLVSKKNNRQKLCPKLLPDSVRARIPFKAKPRSKPQVGPATPHRSLHRCSKTAVLPTTNYDCSITGSSITQGESSQSATSDAQLSRSLPDDYSNEWENN